MPARYNTLSAPAETEAPRPDPANVLRAGRALAALAATVVLATGVISHVVPATRLAGQPTAALTTGAQPDGAAAATAEAAAAATAAATTSTFGSRPHIMLVTLDDVGWNDFGTHSTDLDAITPTMTTLAESGVRLTQYYGQSLCTPARAALHSGKFVHRTGFTTLTMEIEITAFSNYSVPLKHKLLAQRLADDAGYATTFIGKWNIGHCADEYAPWNRGFDYYLGYFASGVNYATYAPDNYETYALNDQQFPLHDMLEATRARGIVRTGADWGDWGAASNYTDVVFAHIAVQRVKAHAAQYGAEAGGVALAAGSPTPLYMHLALHGPHDDFGADPDADATLVGRAVSAPGGKGERAAAQLAALEADASDKKRYKFARALLAADGALGKTLDAAGSAGLVEAGLVVVVASDNGGWPCGTSMRGSNEPLRGNKFHYTEGALRVPAFVWASERGAAAGLLPTAARGGAYAGLMHHVDWLATFVHLGGATTDDDAEIDSRAMWDALARADAAGAVSPREEVVFALDAHYFALRVGRYKLTRETINATWWGDLELDDDSPVMCIDGQPVTQLFDVVADPNERVDLFGLKEYEGVTRNITRRAVNLLETQSADLTWPFGAAKDFSLEYEAIATAFHDAGDYVVPWGCGVQ